jgi:hypothetical protein
MANVYSLDFYDKTGTNPPVLQLGQIGFGGGRVQKTNTNGSSYIVGNPNDPHWKTYPKHLWPWTAINTFPIRSPATQYDARDEQGRADGVHNLMYVAENNTDDPTHVYATLLAKHYRDIAENIQIKQAAERAAVEARVAAERAAAEARAELLKRDRIRQVKELLRQNNNTLKELKKNKTTFLQVLARDRRTGLKNRLTEQQIIADFNRKYPQTLTLQSTIDVVETNIENNTNELRNLEQSTIREYMLWMSL